MKVKLASKNVMLSEHTSVFDSLGFLAPVTTKSYSSFMSGRTGMGCYCFKGREKRVD